MANRMDWPADAVITKMSYAPETLQHFALAWENDWFRLYRVLEPGEVQDPEQRPPPSSRALVESPHSSRRSMETPLPPSKPRRGPLRRTCFTPPCSPTGT